MNNNKPRLFGITHSNRNFEKKDAWGKNQFNSSFPAALAAFMEIQGHKNIYLRLNKELKVIHEGISTTELYGISPFSEDLFYSFESPYLPYQQFMTGGFPRIDLVTINKQTGNCLKGIEIKLTTLPDNSTCDLDESMYGCELVVRPDTIAYLAGSIVSNYRSDVRKLQVLIGQGFQIIEDWREGNNVLATFSKMIDAIDTIAMDMIDKQSPLVMQPIWKTQEKSPRLSDNCLDVFIWSNFAFVQLFLDIARKELKTQKTITRQVRTVVWLFKMLYDFSIKGQFDRSGIIDNLSYDTKNDKAFSVNGKVTYPYMKCDYLASPRITKWQIKDIILGGGQNLLSPERRFDAIISNAMDLFE